MSKFEILCTTMHQNDFSKIKEMNVHSDIVFANQCDHTSYEEISFEGHIAKMISTQTRGVGKNRNLALIYSSADICLMADDDVVYNDGYEKIIYEFYDTHPDADVVVFNFAIARDGQPIKSIVHKTEKLKRKKLSYGTYAISVKRSAIDWHNIRFHHYFGGGALYSCGEDTLFLNDCFDKKLTVYTCAKTLGTVIHNDSTWFNGYTDNYFIDKGIVFYLSVKKFAVLASLYHCLKHKNEYSEIGWKKAFNLIKQGIKKAKKMD